MFFLTYLTLQMNLLLHAAHGYRALIMAGALLLCSAAATATAPSQPATQVDFSSVRINDAFWSPRLARHASATLPVCIDQIENQTGRIRNFENAALGQGSHSGIFFDDSDVYKALEGIAYSLTVNPNPELERKADEWIDKFAAAQQPDGYINTFYTLTAPDKRWTDMDKHEMYCAGHMMEAAVAYYKATGKRKLLDVCIRMADHMMSLFGPGKRHWVPGHEEIELALVKLADAAGRPEYIDFAQWLLEERGHGHGTKGDGKPWNREYYQDLMPVSELTDISGHAVRCMYLYSGMADVAARRGTTSYIDAMRRLWDDVVRRNMYITGGIGSSHTNEGFTADYDLPNLEAYCETCASVGMVLWNHRLNLMLGDSKYADVMERALYNGVLSGINLAGDRFFYVNPLESKGDHHRKAWYGCACCPSQLSRFLPSLGSYIYSVSPDAVNVNLYVGSSADIDIDGKKLTLTQQTAYPYDGTIRITASGAAPAGRALRLRLPAWVESYTLSVNGKKIDATVDDLGYLCIADWNPTDEIVLALDMPVKMVAADPRVQANVGRRAVMRGPVVYCVEQADNAGDFDAITLSPSTTFSLTPGQGILEGITLIDAATPSGTVRLLPYYAWDNREPGKMRVWLPYAE